VSWFAGTCQKPAFWMLLEITNHSSLSEQLRIINHASTVVYKRTSPRWPWLKNVMDPINCDWSYVRRNRHFGGSIYRVTWFKMV
jgi:hypothetical protein